MSSITIISWLVPGTACKSRRAGATWVLGKPAALKAAQSSVPTSSPAGPPLLSECAALPAQPTMLG